MKIAFATIGDTRDIRRGSGTPYYLWQELLRQGVNVSLIGPLNLKTPMITRICKRLSQKLGKRYLSYRDPFMGREIGKAVEKSYKTLDYDVLLTNDYCIAGYSEVHKPIVLYTDDIFPVHYIDNINPRLANLSKISTLFCQETTRQGLKKATRCFFASEFAIEYARAYHLPGSEGYMCIPYGANLEAIEDIPNRSMESLHQKGRLDLLFIGKDWERKGGQVAVDATRLLNKSGFNAYLHVVGTDFSTSISEPFIKFYGLLNKNVEQEKALIETNYKNCDILFVPSKAEGYGLVFVEAAAYGMPSLAYKSTGVKTAVKDGVSGILLEPYFEAEAFAHEIENWWANPQIYNDLSLGARKFYEENGNWTQAVRKLLTELTTIV